MPPVTFDRRSVLLRLAAASSAASLGSAAEAQEAGLITGSVCLVQPETTAGPFYLGQGQVRSDISEGRDGVPLRLRLQVVSADCAPIPDARVDVWHCDARGVYSGVEGSPSTTFLRGTQMTDGQGVATFRSVFPGWYPGRAPHVHYKVFLDRQRVLTSQLFFPEKASATVYQSAAPYAGRELPDRPNSADGIARRAGAAAIAQVTGSTGDLQAALVVGIA